MGVTLAALSASGVPSAVCAWLMAALAILLYTIFVAISVRTPRAHIAVLATIFCVGILVVAPVSNALRLDSTGLARVMVPLDGVLALPFAVLVALAVLVTAMAVAYLAYTRRWQRAHLVPSSVKDALDNLPQGICFAQEDGTTVLSNIAMARIARGLGTAPLLDADALWDKALSSGETAGDDLVLVTLPDGTSWMLARTLVEVASGRCRQLVATDVSEERRLADELAEQGERLRQLNDDLRAYGRTVAEVTREREMLDAKVSVHDGLGSILLMTEYYLDHQDDYDVVRLLGSWRTAMGMLLSEEDLGHDGGLDAVIAAARALGVELRVDGEPPAPGTVAARLAARALREGVANAARHAGATVVEARFAAAGTSGAALELVNDGAPPAGPVTEAGGLLSLRRAVEAAGGSMRVEHDPRFRLLLTLPR